MYLCNFISQFCHYFLVTMFSTNVVFLGHTCRKSSELPNVRMKVFFFAKPAALSVRVAKKKREEDRNLIKLQFTLLPLCDEKV